MGLLRYMVVAALLAFCLGQLRLWVRSGWCATFLYSLAMLLMYPLLGWQMQEPNVWVAVAYWVGTMLVILGMVISATREQGAHRLFAEASIPQLLIGRLPKGRDIPKPPGWRFYTAEALMGASACGFLSVVATFLWHRLWPVFLFGPAAVGIVSVTGLKRFLGR